MRTGRRNIIGIGREVMARRKDGSQFPVALSIGEAHTAGGVRFVGLMRDLTSEKLAAEAALRQREQMTHVSRLTTMGEMAAGIAHEINQPLSAIATYTAACSRLLDQGVDSIEDVRSALQQINAQAHRAADVIRRIRNFTRSREVIRRDITIRALLDEIQPLIELDAKANSTRVSITIDPGVPVVTVDSIQIQQVVLNLVRNGIDAMSGLPSAERAIRIHASADSPDTVRIEISDHGPGIPDDVRANLFTPFFTTKKGGMGMGLAISRSIVTAHGGRLEAANDPSGGARFAVILPINTEE
jgi:two-component system sensor kinase FixL